MRKLFAGFIKFVVAVPLIAACMFFFVRAEVDTRYADSYTRQLNTQENTIAQLQAELDETKRQLAIYMESEKTDYVLECTMTLCVVPELAGDFLKAEYPLVLHTTRVQYEQWEPGDDISNDSALLTYPESDFWFSWTVTVDSKKAIS